MKRILMLLAGLLLLVSPPAVLGQSSLMGTMLDFDTMVGVSGPFVGTMNPIRGIPGGGLPWTIGAAEGSLSSDGMLEVRVMGLVLADDPLVPADRRLMNPQPGFKAIVSCLTADNMGNPTYANLETDVYPATPTGDTEIRAKVMLPYPCIAPIVFVASPGGNWFAVTGR